MTINRVSTEPPQLFNITFVYPDTRMRRPPFLLVAIASAILCTSAVAHAQVAPAPYYRVFLHDGSTISSFGEWARVDDRLVFSMPLVPDAGPSDLHLVSLPISRIDLDRTERYADAVRASQYAAGRGEADFMRLSDEVARALNQVAQIPNPAQRLVVAERARRALADWPLANYGYRAQEVREIVGVLDEVISSLRASAGGRQYDLELTATTPALPAEPLMPLPDQQELVDDLVTAATLVDSPVEKVSLLQSVLGMLDRAVGMLPESFSNRIRTIARGGIEEEQRIDSLYARLRLTTLTSASQLSARADVRGLARLRDRVRQEDVKLGSKRPDDLAAVIATLDLNVDTAHLLRLQQDQWLSRIEVLRAYKRTTNGAVTTLAQAADGLDDIRALAGPSPQKLRALQQRVSREARALLLIEPPKELVHVHAVLRSAFELAENAINLRSDAVALADIELARRAASAAAGSVLLLARARADLDAAMQPPVAPGTTTKTDTLRAGGAGQP